MTTQERIEIQAIVRAEIRSALKELGVARKVKRCDFCFGEAFADEELVHLEDMMMPGVKCRRDFSQTQED